MAHQQEHEPHEITAWDFHNAVLEQSQSAGSESPCLQSAASGSGSSSSSSSSSSGPADGLVLGGRVEANCADHKISPAPPNPFAEGGACKEVSHTKLFRVWPATSSHKLAVLEHVLTGERVTEGLGSMPQLHMNGEFAYVSFADGTTKWANSLVAWSVWECPDGQFMYRKHNDSNGCHDGWETRWLRDVAKERKLHYLLMEPHLHQAQGFSPFSQIMQ